MVRDMAGHSLQLPLHGDDQLQACLALPDVPPDLSEDVEAGAGVLSRQSSQVPAVFVSVVRLAHSHGDQEEGQEEEEDGGLHYWGEARTRTGD